MIDPQHQPALSLAVLVVSCDKYADLWKPFFTNLDRYWPARPGPVYLITNHEEPRFPGVEVIAVGEDRSWSDNLKKALTAIPADYVLLFLEDLILTAAVNREELTAVLEWIAKNRPNHVRLNPSESPYRPHDERVGLVPPGAPYRTSTVLTVWKKAVLADLLAPGENAWQFELKGSERSDAFGHFYSSYKRHFPIVNGVIKGKWQPFAVRMLERMGTPLDLQARDVMGTSEAIRFGVTVARARAFKLVPWQFRRALRRLLAG